LNILFIIAVGFGGAGVACFVKANELPRLKKDPRYKKLMLRGTVLFAIGLLVELVILYQNGVFEIFKG